MNGLTKPGSVPLPAPCALTVALAFAAHAAALPAQFVKPPAEHNETGDVILYWDTGETNAIHQVEHSRNAEFSSPDTWYEGPSRQAFLSGIEGGEHFYRVRARRDDTRRWGAWSETIRVNVERQSLALAWKLFAVGGALFVSIAGFIVYHSTRGGNRR